MINVFGLAQCALLTKNLNTMTGKQFIEDRINTGSRFLVSLHEDTREQIALLLEQYAALRQPPVSSSVCPCNELHNGEIAISSKSLQKPYGDLGQTDC